MTKSGEALLALVLAMGTTVDAGLANAQPTDCRRITAAAEQLVWSPGGPDQVGFQELLEAALATGSYESVICIENQLNMLIAAGVLDVRAFLTYIPAMEQVRSPSGPAGWSLRRAADLAELRSSAKESLYRDILTRLHPGESIKVAVGRDQQVDVGWDEAARNALAGGKQGDLDLVVRGLESKGGAGRLPVVERRLRAVEVRVARARLSPDPVASLTDLARAGFVSEDLSDLTELERSNLVRQALWGLLKERRVRTVNEKDVVNRLKGIWQELRTADREAAGRGRGLGYLRGASPLRYFELFATPYLIGAIRSFSASDFESDWWRKCFPEGPGDVMRSLMLRHP